jgi:WD40 repeat protein
MTDDDLDQADEQLFDELRAAFEPVRFTVPVDSLRLLERSGSRQSGDIQAVSAGSRQLPRRGFIAIAAAAAASVAVAGGATLALRGSQPAASGAGTASANLRKIAAIPLDKSGFQNSSLALSPDGQLLTFADASRIQLWNVADPTHPVHTVTIVGTYSDALFTPDARTLIISGLAPGSQHGAVQLWNIEDPARPTRVSHVLAPRNLAVSGDGQVLVVSDAAGTTLQLWDLANPSRPTQVGTLQVSPSGPLGLALALSRDGKTLAAGDQKPQQNTAVTLWDISHPAHPVQQGTVSCPLGLSGFVLLDLTNPPLGIISGGNGVELWRLADQPTKLTTLPQQGSKALLTSILDGAGTTLAVGRGGAPKGGGLVTFDQVSIWDISDPSVPVNNGIVPLTPPGSAGVAIDSHRRTVAVATGDHVELWRY